jgi:hypothetical protein
MEPETVEYAIKEVGKAILFVGFVGLTSIAEGRAFNGLRQCGVRCRLFCISRSLGN